MKLWDLTTAGGKPVHWAVRMNHRYRTVSWAIVFVVIGSHLAVRDVAPWVWGALIFQFLLYPQLVYWRAWRASDSLRAEIHNLLLDAVSIGVWLAALGFPLWIAGMLCIGIGMNLSVYRGIRGLVQALLGLGLGALCGVLVFGLRFDPDTTLITALLSIICQAVYLLMFSQGAYARTIKLHETRLKLRQSEQALQRQLSEIQVLQARLTEQANRDPLTGLFNRRYLDATMVREISRCMRESQALSVMLIDIDHFKKVNDSHGHEVGDQVLRKLAGLLEEETRAGDVICRYGGEEFLALLPGMPLEAAYERAQRYRQLLKSRPIAVGDISLVVCISIGIASLPQHAGDARSLIVAADSALYHAKAAGRDCVMVWAPPAAGTPSGGGGWI
jgi:diguanylate cyclase (GGDEF)-like protein